MAVERLRSRKLINIKYNIIQYNIIQSNITYLYIHYDAKSNGGRANQKLALLLFVLLPWLARFLWLYACVK